jgi:hypothetical protein
MLGFKGWRIAGLVGAAGAAALAGTAAANYLLVRAVELDRDRGTLVDVGMSSNAVPHATCACSSTPSHNFSRAGLLSGITCAHFGVLRNASCGLTPPPASSMQPTSHAAEAPKPLDPNEWHSFKLVRFWVCKNMHLPLHCQRSFLAWLYSRLSPQIPFLWHC